MTPLLTTIIPDEVIVTLLCTIATGVGTAFAFLWTRMNRLSMRVSALTSEVGIYRHCPAPVCPLKDVRHDFNTLSQSEG
ncbi:hypothetical protein UFOVP672_10 [uncultured Caudovirales phage]|uniref:Uncharacterized protein n=1 Tax=uncultured Caudovirales phage TaxID=2100421 RepID=A0A6J5N8J4_9CAUD|nr:hypothetical protein UFOVP672_10 [uncultured Caudovirales phage]